MTTAMANSLTYKLPANISDKLDQTLKSWSGGKVGQLWKKDAALWTGKDEAKWLDWLNLPEEELKKLGEYQSFADEVKGQFNHVLLLGMGGSSLAPEVFSITYGGAVPVVGAATSPSVSAGYPSLRILDSTDPQQIRNLTASVNFEKTLFVVSSKSGSTLEPNIYMAHFLALAKAKLGEKAASHFVAITDPGSKLEGFARAEKFRHIFHGLPGVGGRYSALSPFGVVPATLIGMDMPKFLAAALQTAQDCKESNAEKNPGVLLGAIMGSAALCGHDKLTIVTSPSIHDFGAWLEQLVAESTGKEGKAIIPVDLEELGDASVYGQDRLFVFVKLDGDKNADSVIEAKLSELAAAGHPVVTITLADKINLAAEFFRFEIATAVAGAVISINPFDQPDVEASKIETRELTEAYEKNGSLPPESPFYEEGHIKLFTDKENESVLKSGKNLVDILRTHLSRLSNGDYFALLAYIEMNAHHMEEMQKLRHLLRDKKKVATCLGFGPRFLHSTGQAYKGGPNSGVFLQITCDDVADLAVPGQKYTFGVVKQAQARGDFQVLVSRKRRALRVHLNKDQNNSISTALKQLADALASLL